MFDARLSSAFWPMPRTFRTRDLDFSNPSIPKFSCWLLLTYTLPPISTLTIRILFEKSAWPHRPLDLKDYLPRSLPLKPILLLSVMPHDIFIYESAFSFSSDLVLAITNAPWSLPSHLIPCALIPTYLMLTYCLISHFPSCSGLIKRIFTNLLFHSPLRSK